jgi:FGGY-family pentulose kinase
MMKDPYVLGIDFGTESVRVGIFTPDGTPIIFRRKPYHLSHPRPGWAEQSPDEWWQALQIAVRQALAESNVPPEAIVGIGTDTTSCTVLALDGSYRPLRPAILWMDMRAAEQSMRIAASGHPALKYNGYGAVSAEWLPCKALWLKENEPEVYQKAVRVCECEDWLTYRLTGRWTANINTATIRCYHDRNVGGWQGDFFEKIGLVDLLEKLPAEVLDLGTVVGDLQKEAAEELGLPAGIPVAEGGADAFTAQIGLDVVSPGKLAFYTGSSHLLLGQSAVELHARGVWGAYTDCIIPGQYTVETGQTSSGSILKWFKDQFCGQWAQEAESRKVSTYEILNEQAAQIPPGSEGLIVLDHWQGNRSPHTDANSRGMIWGFSLRHTPAHVARAIMEGVAYGSEQNLRVLRENGFETKEIVICGGVVNSPLWIQIHADISNVPITITRVSEASTLGSAILGAVAAKLYSSVPEASNAMVHTERQIEPNQEVHNVYQYYFESYTKTYPAMKELMHGMVTHVARRT